MAKSSHNDSRNLLLSKLSVENFDSLQPHLHRIELEAPQAVYEPNQPIRYAYFLESGMLSIVCIMEDGRTIEVSTIGREGVALGSILLPAARVPYRYITQIGGQALRIESSRLIEAAERSPELRGLIFRYVAVQLTRSMQNAACNGLHTVQQRCCRWLLTARDRCDSDEIPLTHEFLAMMLAVRRASVTDVLRPLQDAGMISSTRGRFTILDRPALEAGACECYRIVAAQQDFLLNH